MNTTQLEILALLYAANARVLGMEAANQGRAVNGNSPAYTEDHFQSEASHLEYLAQRAVNS